MLGDQDRLAIFLKLVQNLRCLTFQCYEFGSHQVILKVALATWQATPATMVACWTVGQITRTYSGNLVWW